jgi:ATP-binding cassette, subfamily F, member 3
MPYVICFKTNECEKMFVTRTVFEHLNAGIVHGERVAIVGPNGVGETTLLKVLTGEIQPDEGSVSWDKTIERIGLLTQTAVFAEGETIWEYVQRAWIGLLALEEELREIEVLLARADIS